MTDLEELLRESLRTAPAATPTIADPLAVVNRRVTRVRRSVGAVVAGVAVAAAVVVVPLAISGSGGGAKGEVVPATPSPSGVPRFTKTVWDDNAVAVTVGGGYLWELQGNPKAKDGSGYVVKVEPRSHEALAKWDVQAPFSSAAYGLGRVWVWGASDAGHPNPVLQVVDPSQPDESSPAPLSLPAHGVGSVAFLDNTAWVVTDGQVWGITPELDVSTKTSFARPAERVVATTKGELWVSTGGQLYRLDPSKATDGSPSRPGSVPVADSVPWAGRLLGASSSGGVWTALGKGYVVDLAPAKLHQGESVAQGARLRVAGAVSALYDAGPGGVYALSYRELGAVNGVVWWSRAAIDGGPHGSGAALGLAADQIAVNPAGGIDFATDDLIRSVPDGGGSSDPEPSFGRAEHVTWPFS